MLKNTFLRKTKKVEKEILWEASKAKEKPKSILWILQNYFNGLSIDFHSLFSTDVKVTDDSKVLKPIFL